MDVAYILYIFLRAALPGPSPPSSSLPSIVQLEQRSNEYELMNEWLKYKTSCFKKQFIRSKLLYQRDKIDKEYQMNVLVNQVVWHLISDRGLCIINIIIVCMQFHRAVVRSLDINGVISLHTTPRSQRHSLCLRNTNVYLVVLHWRKFKVVRTLECNLSCWTL